MLADGDASELQIAVSDTGIAQEDLERVFSPFAQRAVPRRSPPGIGLGLSICRHYAGLMRGSLAVRSKPESGSTVRLAIPLPEGGDDVALARMSVSDSEVDPVVDVRPTPGALAPLSSDRSSDQSFAPILESYLDSISATRELLQKVHERSDLEEVHRLLHDIKGTAGSYGFPTVSKKALTCETLLRAEQDSPAFEQAFDDLLLTLDALTSEMSGR